MEKISWRRVMVALLLVSFTLPALSQFKLTDPIPVDPNVKIGKLPNGLTYYIQKNAKPEKKLELRLVINAGSVLEDNSQRGLAHFMEHMSFNGSKNFPKNQLVDYLQKTGVEFGADLNAYTSFDETVYILPIPTDKPETVEKGFTVLEDWAFNNLFDKQEINKERGVVLEESRLSKGAEERMRRKYFPKIFNGSLYADRLPIGSDSILKTFKPETLQRFYKQWYRPNLIAVLVVGDIDPADAEKKIKAHFSKFNNPANAKPRPAMTPIPARTKPEAMVLTDDEATNTMLQVFNFVKLSKKVKTWADYRESLVENLVTQLINQRLQELTQQENPPFLYGYSGFTPFLRGHEVFVSYAVIGNSSTQKAIDALVAETERARQYGFLTSELDRAKASLQNDAERANHERNKLESDQIVSRYVSHYLQGEPAPGEEADYQFLKQVLPSITLEEINAIASKMPANKNAFALITAPTKMKDKLPAGNELLKELVAASSKPVKPYEEKIIAQQLLDKEPAPGKVTASETNQKLGTTNLTLSNGVTVTLKSTTFKNDQISMDAWRLGGAYQFSLADKDNAQAAARLVNLMGVKDMSPTDLGKFLAGKTVSVQPYINNYEDGIEGGSSVKDFETFLQLTYLYFTQPRKDETLFKSFVTKTKSSLQFIKQNPQAFFGDTLSAIIYQNNPWADRMPTETTLNNLNLDRSLDIYKQVFGNAYGMHFTFVGNIDVDAVKPLLEKYLGSLPASPMENKCKDNNLRPVKGIVNASVKKGKEPQSLIVLAFNGETEYTPKESLALKALTEVLNIRVIEKLREEMGGMYGGGFSGNISKRPYTSYSVSANIPCGPENVDRLTTALFDLIKEVQNKGIEQKNLDKVKATWKKQYGVNVQSNDFWLSTLSTAWINKDNPENILNYEQNVNALTVDDLQKAARKYLDTNNYVKAVLYPDIPVAQTK